MQIKNIGGVFYIIKRIVLAIDVFQSTLILIGVGLLSSCQSHKKADVDVTSGNLPIAVVPGITNSNITQCKSPRSPICTREYRAVCASRDTGVRCITTPYPSTETVTKSNA